MTQEFSVLRDLVAFVVDNLTPGKKAFCRLGSLGPVGVQQVARLIDNSLSKCGLVIDGDAIRHIMAQHGVVKSKSELAKGQIPIAAPDLLALKDWLPKASIVRAGQVKPGKQPRVEVDRQEVIGTTTVILEWRPGRQQLALVTMYKKRPAA